METPYGSNITYTGTAPVSLSPTRDTFSIGDTIWIEMDIPPTIFDQNSAEMVNISQVDLEFIIGSVIHLYWDAQGQAHYYYAENEFDVFSEKGVLQAIQSSPSFIHIICEQDSTDQHKIARGGIVPRNSGLFSIGFATRSQQVEGQIGDYCYSFLELSFTMNDNLDSNNYQLIAPYGIDLIGTFEQCQTGARYSFVVE
ncbi:MAG: hypothetical protein R2792_08005 [Saprospiraceae bacterium]